MRNSSYITHTEDAVMPEQQIYIPCDVCGLRTLVKFQTPENDTTGNDQTIQKRVNCRYCGQLYLLTIPSNWDSHPHILGDDVFLGYWQGLPVIRGEKL